jgi:hypothetical protein
VAVLVGGGRSVAGHPFKGPTAADTSMATKFCLSACAGHQPSGQRSFWKRRTVDPLTGPTRYNLIYASASRRARARAPAAEVGCS